MTFTKPIEIRWRDLDGFSHVNNSVYLTYLEEARDEFFTGLLGDTVHRVVVRRVEIDFMSGLTQEDDRVEVVLELVAFGASSATTRERIVSVADGRVAASARSVMVHTNAERSASQPWDEGERARLEEALCNT